MNQPNVQRCEQGTVDFYTLTHTRGFHVDALERDAFEVLKLVRFVHNSFAPIVWTPSPRSSLTYSGLLYYESSPNLVDPRIKGLQAHVHIVFPVAGPSNEAREVAMEVNTSRLWRDRVSGPMIVKL